MKLTRILGMTIIFLALLFSIGCQKKETIDVDFAHPMTEEVLLAINQEDYDIFSKDLSNTMEQQITQEFFTTQIVAMKNIIGEYQEGSKKLLSAKQVDKNYIQVIYNAKYSNEEGDVIITITFNTNPDNREIEGFFMNSPKLQKM